MQRARRGCKRNGEVGEGFGRVFVEEDGNTATGHYTARVFRLTKYLGLFELTFY